jgi:hypothetical protein
MVSLVLLRVRVRVEKIVEELTKENPTKEKLRRTTA